MLPGTRPQGFETKNLELGSNGHQDCQKPQSGIFLFERHRRQRIGWRLKGQNGCSGAAAKHRHG